MNRKKLSVKSITGLAGAAVITFALLLSSCGKKDAGGGEFKFGKIKLQGKDGVLCHAPVYIAYEQGFFAEEGFDVELISANAESRKIGLNNGTIPVINGDFQYFPSIEEGINMKVVEGLHNGCIKFGVRPDSDIKDPKDLIGKKIAVDRIGGTPHQVASLWFEQGGVSARPERGQVSFLPFENGSLQLEALANGSVDAVAMWDPLISIAEKDGRIKVIFDLATHPSFAGKYCCFLYASGKILDENPKLVAALLRAYRKATNWISANPREAVAIISDKKYSGITDKELAEALIKSYEYPSAHDHSVNKQDVEGDVKYFAEELQKIGYLKTPADEFVKKAYAKVDLVK